MNVVIRADAGPGIGGGHLMRCLALADMLATRGDDVMFVTRADEQPWGAMLRARGHQVTRLTGALEQWPQDLEATQATLEGRVSDWLIVDHYSLGREWEHGMRPCARRILAIDDIARPHDCDVLLDQNVLADKDAYRDRVPAACRRLLGPRYALLRSEFEMTAARTNGDRVRNVVIGFGASDPTGETEKAVEAFLLADIADVRAQVVVGAANPRAEALRQMYGGEPRLEIHMQTERMAALLSTADLAVGAGGISTWERACLGVPSIVVAVADNQTPIAEKLAGRGSHCYLGQSHEVNAAGIAASLALLAQNRYLRAFFSESSRALCDGQGTRRVAAVLRSSPIMMRRATAEDSDRLYSWRNAKIVRCWSGNSAMVDRAVHQRWLAEVLADDHRHLLIGEDGEGAVGVVRYDVQNEAAEVSIYLVPGRIGRGQGAALLAAGQAWIVENVPTIGELRARVREGNSASVAMFEHAGYRLAEHEFRLSLNCSLEAS